MTYLGSCRRCGATTYRRYTDGAGITDVCARCGHPVEVDAAKVHDLLNRGGRPPEPGRYECAVCGAEVRDAAVCTRCWRDVARWLRQIPDLSTELDVTIAKQTRYADAQRVSGSPTPPLPLQPEAAAVADEMRAVLVSWVKLAEEETAP